MNKWEYLKVDFYGGSGGEGKISLNPRKNIDLAAFLKKWPKVTLREEKYESYLAFEGFDPLLTAAFLDYVGELGWEAYAADKSSYYFKRQTA
jgi:hypothetical protein